MRLDLEWEEEEALAEIAAAEAREKGLLADRTSMAGSRKSDDHQPVLLEAAVPCALGGNR